MTVWGRCNELQLTSSAETCGERIPCNTGDETTPPPRANCPLNFLDNREGANAERCANFMEIFRRDISKATILVVCAPTEFGETRLGKIVPEGRGVISSHVHVMR